MNDIEWTTAPKTKDKPIGYQLKRCPCGSTPPLIILSDRIIGAELHWLGGRSSPHLKHNCPGCLAKTARVWKGYLAVIDPRTQQLSCLEITPPCVDALNSYAAAWGSIRGAAIRLSRSTTKANGRIKIEITQSTYATERLPQPFDVHLLLEQMWQTTEKTNKPQMTTPRNPQAEKEAAEETDPILKREATLHEKKTTPQNGEKIST